ncbi:protein peste-like [Teleopsis dalmanni]|uniref:protein peste-like n=1 Tax=Teleopsis dalmanni TaxID=139649 RepID=UPI0018CF5A4C|nr:protein peste-like [Teleopsis dalmanni]
MPTNSSKLSMSQTKDRHLILRTCGLCIAILGLFTGLFWHMIFKSILHKELVLRPNSRIYDFWKNPPIKLNVDFYLFNWTNSEDLYNPSIKPKFEELGPYRYIENPEKLDVVWHPENATVSYRKRSDFRFVPSSSKGQLNDMITAINPPAVVAATRSKRMNEIRRTLIDITLNVYANDMCITKSAEDILFRGFHDMLLVAGTIVPTAISAQTVPYDKFGYCYPRNYSADFYGVFNVHTGADDITKVGQIHNWKFKSTTEFLPDKCSQIYGSPGEIQPSNLKEGDTLNLFLPDLCRPIPMEYSETVEVEGVRGFKYIAGLKAVDNGTLYPGNECYCNGECVPSGVVNITACWFDAPIFLSYPHFYNADPYFENLIEGMKPDKEKHEFFLVIDPVTGLALDVGGRLQLNILVEPIPHLKRFKNVRKAYYPLFWLDATARISPELATELILISSIKLYGQVAGGICFLIGLFLFLWHPLKGHFNRRLMQHIKINDITPEATTKSTDKNEGTPETLSFLGDTKNGGSLYPKIISTDSENKIITNLTTNSSAPKHSHLSLNSS